MTRWASDGHRATSTSCRVPLMVQSGEGASIIGARDTAAQVTIAPQGRLSQTLVRRERRMWKLKLIGQLMTIVFWVYSLILVYSVMMSIFRSAFGVHLPNPFSIFQA